MCAPRLCTTSSETPSGKYAQVDFGQTRLRRGDGTRVKVYFMVMLLCRSRYKFVWFSDRPFTSETASEAHEKSFGYFHGVPRHILYDQDAVFLYDEHLGDYRMTTVFESYVKSRPFGVELPSQQAVQHDRESQCRSGSMAA